MKQMIHQRRGQRPTIERRLLAFCLAGVTAALAMSAFAILAIGG